MGIRDWWRDLVPKESCPRDHCESLSTLHWEPEAAATFQTELEVNGYTLPGNLLIHPFDSRTGTGTGQHGCSLCLCSTLLLRVEILTMCSVLNTLRLQCTLWRGSPYFLYVSVQIYTPKTLKGSCAKDGFISNLAHSGRACLPGQASTLQKREFHRPPFPILVSVASLSLEERACSQNPVIPSHLLSLKQLLWSPRCTKYPGSETIVSSPSSLITW